jgi:hypothetical protein
MVIVKSIPWRRKGSAKAKAPFIDAMTQEGKLPVLSDGRLFVAFSIGMFPADGNGGLMDFVDLG